MLPRESYYIDVEHEGLNKFRRITGSNHYVVEQKAAAQLNTWQEMWQKKVEIENRKKEKEKAAKNKEAKIQLAKQKTEDAEKALKNINDTLLFTLDIDDTIDWDNCIPEPKWQNGGVNPTLSTTAGYVDILSVYWNGTSYYGTVGPDWR